MSAKHDRTETGVKEAETSRSESEEKFRTLFNSTNDAILILDLEGRFVEVNETACRRLGYTREELLRKTPVEIDTPEFAHDVGRRIREIRRKGHAFFETAQIASDGTVIPTELSAKLIEYDGKPAILSIARDITERRRSELALRESEEKYSKLFHESNDAIFIHDLAGTIIDVNRRVLDFFGYTREEILALNISDLHPPEALARSREAFETIAACGFVNFEVDFRTKSGAVFPAEVSASLFEIGGRRVIQGIVRDLTERRRTEQALRQSQELYETLARTSPESITVTDLSGTITYVSPNTLAMHGYEREEELLGRSAFDLIAPEEHDRAAKNIRRTLQHGSVRNIEYTLIKKDGTRFTGELNAALVKDDADKPQFFIATVRDVTDRKRIEEQLRQSQKMEAIGVLAGGVAHDFNNLLIPILGYADLLTMKLGDADPTLKEYVAEIKKTAERANALSRQLLALSRRQVLTMMVLDLNSLLSNLEGLLIRLIRENIEFTLQLQPGLMPVKADPGQIELIVINIVVNACDAMPEGGKLAVRTENTTIDAETAKRIPGAEPGSYVCIAAEDTGIGMDAQTINRIFEPFFSTKEPGRGTGLGLSMVYGSVRQHDGFIDVQSEKGKGTTFRIFLPASISIVEGRPERDEAIQDIRGANERILIVEDDGAVRELTERILAGNGYRVLTATQTDEAYEILARENESIDLVLCDVVLPGLDGIQFVEELRSRNPDIKIVLTSGYAAPKPQWRIIQEKGYRFLQKPYTMVDLLKAVKEACRSSS